MFEGPCYNCNEEGRKFIGQLEMASGSKNQGPNHTCIHHLICLQCKLCGSVTTASDSMSHAVEGVVKHIIRNHPEIRQETIPIYELSFPSIYLFINVEVVKHITSNHPGIRCENIHLSIYLYNYLFILSIYEGSLLVIRLSIYLLILQ